MQNPLENDGKTPSRQVRTAGAQLDPSDDATDTGESPMRATTLIASFGYAFEGLGYALRTQRNLKVHCVIALAVLVVGLLLGISLDQWAVLAVMVGLVFQTELTNTAVEAIVDRVSPEFHTLAKVAKDCSAAAVLVTAVAAVAVGLLIFGPRILTLLKIG
jgi:diacylglycerol kinase (ATP)